MPARPRQQLPVIKDSGDPQACAYRFRMPWPDDSYHFPSRQRHRNHIYISGVPRGKYAKPPKLDEPPDLADPSPFLEGTPFAGILTTPLSVDIPPESRPSHHWIVAGTGAGKTTALQYFIAKD